MWRPGFDSLTHYQYVHFTDTDRDYREITEDAVLEWQKVRQRYEAHYYPMSPWVGTTAPEPSSGSVRWSKTTPPDQVEAALRAARDFVDQNPGKAPLITINGWNEWTEMSYLQPCDRFGYGYLQSVKKVFLANKP